MKYIIKTVINKYSIALLGAFLVLSFYIYSTSTQSTEYVVQLSSDQFAKEQLKADASLTGPQRKALHSAHTTYAKIADVFKDDLTTVPSLNAHDLKEFLFMKNYIINSAKKLPGRSAYHYLPFCQYKYKVDKGIIRLKRCSKKLTRLNCEHYKNIDNTLATMNAQLEAINSTIIVHEEYCRERLVLAAKENPFGVIKFASPIVSLAKLGL